MSQGNSLFQRLTGKLDSFKFTKENKGDLAQYLIGLATASTVVFFSILFAETIDFVKAGLSLCATIVTLLLPFVIRSR